MASRAEALKELALFEGLSGKDRDFIARTPVRAYVMTQQQFGALSKSPEVLSRLQAAIADRLAHDRLVSSWHE